MNGRTNRIRITILILLTLSFLVLMPITLANDQIVISFDPDPGNPPEINLLAPADGATGQPTTVTLSAEVYDETNDPVDVYFYDATDDSLIGVDYDVPSDWSTASVVWSGLSNGQTYLWYAIARVHGYSTKSATWDFKTVKSSPPSGDDGGGGGGFIPMPPNQDPIAKITAPTIGYVNETLVFYGYYSIDKDGYLIGYQWDFDGDGEYETGWLEDLLITHNFSSPGNYTVVLQVKDDDGAINTSEPHTIQIIELEEPLQLPFPVTNGPFYAYTNDIIRLSSEGSYDPDGIIVNYTWNFGDGNKSYLENPNHSYSEPGNYTIILTVKDNDNLTNSVSTKAVIIDERERPPAKDDQPFMLILFLIIVIIATIIILIIRSKTYKFTMLVEKTGKLKQKHEDAKEKEDIHSKVDRELDQHSTLESKVDQVLSDLEERKSR